MGVHAPVADARRPRPARWVSGLLARVRRRRPRRPRVAARPDRPHHRGGGGERARLVRRAATAAPGPAGVGPALVGNRLPADSQSWTATEGLRTGRRLDTCSADRWAVRPADASPARPRAGCPRRQGVPDGSRGGGAGRRSSPVPAEPHQVGAGDASVTKVMTTTAVGRAGSVEPRCTPATALAVPTRGAPRSGAVTCSGAGPAGIGPSRSPSVAGPDSWAGKLPVGSSGLPLRPVGSVPGAAAPRPARRPSRSVAAPVSAPPWSRARSVSVRESNPYGSRRRRAQRRDQRGDHVGHL